MKLTDEANTGWSVSEHTGGAGHRTDQVSTTRSPLWAAVAVAVLSLGLAAVQGFTGYDFSPLPPEKAAMGWRCSVSRC